MESRACWLWNDTRDFCIDSQLIGSFEIVNCTSFFEVRANYRADNTDYEELGCFDTEKEACSFIENLLVDIKAAGSI